MTASSQTARADDAVGGDDEPVALGILRRHADQSSAFLGLNRETRHYRDPAIDGLIAYRVAGRGHLFQLCGPIAAPEDRAALLRSFVAWAATEGRRVTTVQVDRADLDLYARAGFVVNQLGSSFAIDLESFTLAGTRFFKLRNKLKRAAKLGVTVRELPRSAGKDAALDAVDAPWLRSKGRFVKELTFMVGERGGPGGPYRRTFVAEREGQVIAYATYSPCFGARPGWLYDLTRRQPDAPPGTVELIFVTALEALRDEQCRWLHLGLTPLVGLDPAHEPTGHSSPVVSKLVRFLAERGESVYPARAQEAFKRKWHPHVVEPEFVAFHGRPTFAAVWQLMRVTRAI
jgi:lysylphosphatidylglycerol synthetase-like protein (DUF2156 family)